RIIYHLQGDFKKRWGKLAYWIAGFGEVTRELEEFEVRVDGRICRASFALVTKVQNYGGDLRIARRVRLEDDEFEVVLFSGRSGWRYLKYLAGAVSGGLEGMPGVTVLRASHARIEGSPHVQVDGEYTGRGPCEVRIVPDALTLLMPTRATSASS
ncbi:MAG: diacylglycerol/lipid kinase family protein, partial [Bryobacteraceae bacterium]